MGPTNISEKSPDDAPKRIFVREFCSRSSVDTSVDEDLLASGSCRTSPVQTTDMYRKEDAPVLVA